MPLPMPLLFLPPLPLPSPMPLPLLFLSPMPLSLPLLFLSPLLLPPMLSSPPPLPLRCCWSGRRRCISPGRGAHARPVFTRVPSAPRSRNEDLEEIASSDLKYLMLPAYQGALAMKQVNPSKRLDHLQRAREHFLKYLTQCQHYRVAEFELPKPKDDSAGSNAAESSSVAYPNLFAMAAQRQAKIERYKQRKEVERRLAAQKAAVESGQADDQQMRAYYLLLLRRWVGVSLEEIESIDQEMKILREKDSPKEAAPSSSSRQDRPPMKSFILTRNAAQAKVFGAGYPSLATMTVHDWYDQHQKVGVLPDQGLAKTSAEVRKAARRQEEPDIEEDEEDEETLQRAREWDDWKDTHPRGYGNRQNMG
ncbi:immunoglobulin-binding protein 1 [Pteropus vampyrus]|uniref:immunoglobulin-binding protein 1 n=1 Tax=Pteropus vampyrus TaxID=132908 RepID=UPI0005BD908B|nr:immunoglobulin-binding protein 1 [Pteropus vampyrus]